MYIKTTLEGKTERNGKRTSKNSTPSFNIPLAVHVVYSLACVAGVWKGREREKRETQTPATQAIYSSHVEGSLCRYSRQLKLNSEFYKKKELEEISIYSFKPIRSTESKKMVLVLVRSVKFL